METAIPTIGELMGAVGNASAAKQQSSSKPESANDLLDEPEAAVVLGNLAPGTLSVWRSTGRYKIPFIKVGRRVRYRRGDLLAWLLSRTRSNGATA